MPEYNYDGLNDNIEIDAEFAISLTGLAQSLTESPAAMNILAQAISVILTKQARGKGNLFGTWAQKQPAPVVNPPQAIKRLN